MSRARLVLMGILVALWLSPACAQPQAPAGPEVICPLTAASPVMDGRLDDWQPLPQMVIARPEDWHSADPEFAEYGGPHDVSAEVRLVWDNRALYIAVDTRDSTLTRVRSASEIDRGDSIVISLVGEGSGEANQFVVALLKGSSLVWRSRPTASAGAAETVGRALWARQEEDTGWRVTYELSIPWSELAPIRPIPGQTFTLTVSACDDDGQGLKGCLEASVPIVFAPDAAGTIIGRTRPAALAPAFLNPDAARFDRRAFSFRGRQTVLFGGEIDYARLPRESWADRLAALKGAGMNLVGVTIPWSLHQRQPGGADLSGLADFLGLCREAAVWVQLNLGPYASDEQEAGQVPGWVLARNSGQSEEEAAEAWYRALLPVVRDYELSRGGPVATVIIRPLPDATGALTARDLQGLSELVRGAGIEAPVLTANAPAARDNSKQSLANMLDTLAFYGLLSGADMMPRLQRLSQEESGPAAVSALPGDYGDPEAARRSAATIQTCLAMGATAIVLSDFALGFSGNAICAPDGVEGQGVIEPSGARTAGYGEARLIGGLVRQFGPDLAGAVAAEGAVKANDPDVTAVARVGEGTGFIFLWDQKGERSHQVRLAYTPPGTTGVVSIPQAGAIALPAGCAKALVTNAPVGRGIIRYATSEVAGIHQLGDRTLMIVYGDRDTPGEIALWWPGPPLVSGAVTRSVWDSEKSTLILDYYHAREDQYLLVDELEIAILSRERAAHASRIEGLTDVVTLSAGTTVASASLGASGLDTVLDCPPGDIAVSAALPRPPVSVSVDGKPVDFAFSTPARIVSFTVSTEPFEEEGQPSVLDRVGRILLGGPPKLSAEFDRGWFMPEAAAREGSWQPAVRLGHVPEAVGLGTGSFARLRARFNTIGEPRLRMTGSTDPALVFVNGRLVPELSGTARQREADLRGLAKVGENEVEIVMDIRPRAVGYAGLWAEKKLPEVTLVGDEGSAALGPWELSPTLGGEAGGWGRPGLDVSRWHFLRFGPWRDQGRDLERVTGIGWYHVPFSVPRSEGWHVPYSLSLTMHGSAALYLNGSRFATCTGEGTEYRVPLPASLLAEGRENALAAAVYGLSPETGIDRIEIAADREQMKRRRRLSIRF